MKDQLKRKISRPLRGLKIVVTRPEEGSATLARALQELGAETIELPTIRFEPPEDFLLLDDALRLLAKRQYHWCVFTSANGVNFLLKRARHLGLSSEILLQVRLAAIGPATSSALAQHGLKVDAMPEIFIAEEISEAMGDVRGHKILLPRADIARQALPKILRERGAVVDEVAVYRTLPAQIEKESLLTIKEMLLADEIDFITFTSSSTVRAFLQLVRGAGLKDSDLKRVKFACIGPVTQATLQEMGFRAEIVAREHTIPGLIEALIEEATPNE